ncbi:hypothetical protein GNI_143310 [Gregarina niphandrodes]|uniref:Uncharacterized protein n=1 Tax=Gregarina niphandrodes TaxID=110365 RepID=A0A023B027_GRENI|nr:hypothetical protein GNI_143310 [Gregarina niphandrodes]EZG44831.1 hypothetical protein GNI_143310 [Gregarina niphandrodes]|eukprot:XP_011132655.1 hypothetical protein GNI_143310 [Gregarina niphandrodes]
MAPALFGGGRKRKPEVEEEEELLSLVITPETFGLLKDRVYLAKLTALRQLEISTVCSGDDQTVTDGRKKTAQKKRGDHGRGDQLVGTQLVGTQLVGKRLEIEEVYCHD